MSDAYTAEKNSETMNNSRYPPTIRIKVDLFKPTEDRYPIFNYPKLLAEEIKRRRKDQHSNSLDENDESIKQLTDNNCRQKYYRTSGTNLKRKIILYNYSKHAAGYDESDSFIDNTEICDDFMPEGVETKRGGYYLNTGPLEFKKLCLSDDSKEIKSSQPHKHFTNSVLEDNDEKLPSFYNSSEKNSLSETKTSETSNISSSVEEKESIQCVNRRNKRNKRKPPIDSDSASSIIPIKKKEISMVKLSKQEKKVVIPECKPSCSKETQTISSEEIPTLQNNVSSINDKIESVIYAGFSKKLPKVIKSEHGVENIQNIINPPINIDIPVSNGIHNTIEDIPKFVVEIIESIKTEAQIAIQNNLYTFSNQINLYLLSLEYQKELYTFNTQPIYATLAEHMLCDKENLIKHVNELINSEEITIAKPIQRLKNAIDKLLPSVIQQYTLECNKILELRNVYGTFNNGIKSKCGPKRPRRKFPWNDEFRGYVREIVNNRAITYSKIRKSHPIDVYITQFINNRIEPLWPNGWMTTTNILKELKAKEKVSRPKLPKKQSLQNNPTKLLRAIKLESEHQVSNFAMNKSHKWNEQISLEVPRLSTETTIVYTHCSVPTTSNFKQLYSSPHSVTITHTASNGCEQKELDNSKVNVKSEKWSGDDILDLSLNKSNSILSKLKDITVISNNVSKDNNSSSKTVSVKHEFGY